MPAHRFLPQTGERGDGKPDPSIQGRSAEKTPRAPQRMMPAIKTTRATFIRRVRPTGFPPLGPSPARTTPTTRSTVSPSQTRDFIDTPYAAASLPFARSASRAYRAIQTFPESTSLHKCGHFKRHFALTKSHPQIWLITEVLQATRTYTPKLSYTQNERASAFSL